MKTNELFWEIASGIDVALDSVSHNTKKEHSAKQAVTIAKIKSLLETAQQMAADAAKGN